VSAWLIVNARLINEGQVIDADLRIRRGRIEQIAGGLRARAGETLIDARGRYLMPGMIDTQVHFREPGLTRKGSIASESRAAVAGGVTSFLDMPDTSPLTLGRQQLADKFSRAAGRSAANFSFYIGAGQPGLAELLELGSDEACGILVDAGAARGPMAIADLEQLDKLLQDPPMIVAARCEDEHMIEANLAIARKRYHNRIPPQAHAEIRCAQACLNATRWMIDKARAFNTPLHLLGLSRRGQTDLLQAAPVPGKRLSAQTSIAHLYFIDADYETLGNLIKIEPAVGDQADRRALRQALREQRIDLIASAHAPHLLKEKAGNYELSAAGMPLIQYAVPAAWSLVASRTLDPPGLVEKLAHNPARLFAIRDRGFVREGYWADLVLVDANRRSEVDRQPLLSPCGWTPFSGRKLPAQVAATWVNGRLVWRDGLLTGIVPGQKLQFER
jgi:dihydroorotase